FSRTMRISAVSLLLLSVCLLPVMAYPAKGGKLVHFGNCVLSVPIHDLEETIRGIKGHIVSASEGDPTILLLKIGTLDSVRSAESCCFLKQLLAFYLDSVLPHLRGVPTHVRRHASRLGNGLLLLARSVENCHCDCGEEVPDKTQSIRSTFDGMDKEAAVGKAVSEMDIFLNW
uniref:Interleukin family protein n=1 Tax=Lepisosteus oculatus TaxID=7918 RepID=W5N377_LEPOC